MTWIVLLAPIAGADDSAATVDKVFDQIVQHDFHPLNADGSFTNDRQLLKHGIADLHDDDWRIRLLAIRDLVRLLPEAGEDVSQGLAHENAHVRQITAAALGIARYAAAARLLEKRLLEDPSVLVRSQAAMSLGQMESTASLDLLRDRSRADKSTDVRHQCKLAIDQIEHRHGDSDEQISVFRELNPEEFNTLRVGDQAPDFALKDTEGVPWELSKANTGHWVVLIWIFADWCPVCHSEFRDLIEMKREFRDAGVVVATLECHDRHRCQAMVAKQTEIWWPHLSDLAGAVGVKYGVDPQAFAVHAEYINRPSTIIIDPEGKVRFAYYGTFWGDRPTIRQTIDMIKEQKFEFVHPRRLVRR